MRYNQLTYHKANPFYKQDYMPDRAWYNRKPKEYPSQIPTGQQYFTDNGRKHYENKFNHSQIAQTNILKSPQRYVFENRIALDKGYMRNLDTIDIQGAASGTRINQSIKNKFKAQEQLARRYNVSIDQSENKQKTYDMKKRLIAEKQYETLKQRKQKQAYEQKEALNASRISQNYEKYNNKQQLSEDLKNSYYNQYHPQGAQNIKLIPKPYYAKLNSENQQQYSNRQMMPDKNVQQKVHNQKEDSRASQEAYRQQMQRYQQHQQQMQRYQQQQQQEQAQKYQQQQVPQHELSNNYRHKNNPQVYPGMDAQWNRRRQQYMKNSEMQELSKIKMQDKKQFRKNNPTNLSFNLAAQSIVANNMH